MTTNQEFTDQSAADASLDALAQRFGHRFVTVSDRVLTGEILAALPRHFVLRLGVCPIALEDGTLDVAVADPLAVEVIDALEAVAGRPVRVALASADDLQRTIARYYGDKVSGGMNESAAAGANEDRADYTTDVTADDAPVIRAVQELIEEAIRRRASDIHLEPLEKRFRVRYRIDGVLVEAGALPRQLAPAVVSRIKLMGNLSIAEKRVPQDGRLAVNAAGRSVDLRVASLPTAHGESVVLRLLQREELRTGLPELGFLHDHAREFERLLRSPDGMVLVTGPTGSGKTTTLYACLHDLNRPERKIITVEDPVEYQLTGINQVPVRADIGMTFASALRAMLRQSPNVAMVGEIRDAETAEIAINAALTGHLVLSTLHTNDAPGAVARLLDLGVKPFLVAAALRGCLAQRLVRRVCADCAEPDAPAPEAWRALGVADAEIRLATPQRGRGCAVCGGTGFRGRIGIFEMFLISDDLRGMIYENASAARLRARARHVGMRSLRQDGVRKVLAGFTTIEEVLSATVADRDPNAPFSPPWPTK